MREIKFRGKNKLNGEWVCGYVLKTIENRVFIVTETFLDQEPFSLDIKYFEVNPQTIGQYTGLKDKNGIRIYEGDIIDINQTVNGCNLFEIVWDKTRWNAKYAVEMVTPRLYEYDFNELLDVDAEEKEIEVVGNIYEGERK